MGRGETAELGLKTAVKLGQVPRLRCSEAVLDGFEAEKTASHKEHLSLTAFGRFVSGFLIKIGSKCAQYHAPFPFIAFVRTVTNPSYRLFTALAAVSSGIEEEGSVGVELVEAIPLLAQQWKRQGGYRGWPGFHGGKRCKMGGGGDDL